MIAALLQARMSSSRLPGKVLAPIRGRPMLVRQLERIARARTVDRLLVATSADPRDDAVEQAAASIGVESFRGSLEDVLDRFVGAARACEATHVVRLTADCPLADPRVIDAVVELHLAQRNDYTSNVLQLTFPDCLDVEVATAAALERAWSDAHEPYEREHVTPHLYRRPERFRLGCLTRARDLSRLRLTVDHEADLAVVRELYEELHPAREDFGLPEIVAALERRPELLWRNAAHNARARTAGHAPPSTEPFL